MNRLIPLLTLAALTLSALLPVAAFAHGGTELKVVGDVRPDAPMRVVGTQFSPDSVVRVELERDGLAPVALGQVPTDASGSFDKTLQIPATVPSGLYRLAAVGVESASADVAILAPASGMGAPQPATVGASVENQRSTGETVGLALFTAAVALAAGGLLWASRMRPRRAGT